MERLDLQDSVYRTQPTEKLLSREQAHMGEDLEFGRLQLGKRDEIKDVAMQKAEEAQEKRVEEDGKGGSAEDRRKKDRRKGDKKKEPPKNQQNQPPRKKPSLGPQIIDLEI